MDRLLFGNLDRQKIVANTLFTFFVLFLLLPCRVYSQTTNADFRTSDKALVVSTKFTDVSAWEYKVGSNWVAANTVPDSTNNIIIRPGHTVNLINGTTTVVMKGRNILDSGTIILGYGHITGGGSLSVVSGGTLNFGSKNHPLDAVQDNIDLPFDSLKIASKSTCIFSGKTQKNIGKRTFGNVTMMSQTITLSGDITVMNTLLIIDSSSVIANANIILNKGAFISLFGTLNLTSTQVKGGTTGTSKTVTVQNGGTFICNNPDGFYGGNGSAGKLTSIKSDVDKVVLNAGSTVKYNAGVDQFVSTLPTGAKYGNIILANAGIKTLTGNATFNGTLTVNPGVTLDCGINSLSGLTIADNANIKGNIKIGSLSTGGGLQGNIPNATIFQSTGSTFEFSGNGPQTIDGRSYYNLLLNNGSSGTLVGNIIVNGTLQINAANILDLAGKNLTLNSTLSGQGSLKGSLASNVTINGSGKITFIPDFPNNLINNFTVSSTDSVVLGSDLNIAGVLACNAGKLKLNNKTVTLKAGTGNEAIFPSTKTYPQTATVGTMTGTIDYGTSGIFVVERYIPDLRRFRFFTPEVTASGTIRDHWQEGGSSNPGFGTHITGAGGAANGFDVTLTNNPSLFTFNINTQNWEAVSSTLQPSLITAGSAWRLYVRGDRTIDLNDPNVPPPTPTLIRTKGKLLTGDVTFNTINSALPKLSAINDKYSLIGNPYAAPVDWDDLIKYNTSTGKMEGTVQDIKPQYVVTDPSLNMGINGVYVTYNSTSATTAPGASKINGIIQPGQAIFVATTSAANNPNPNPSITFSEANKVSTFTKVFRTPSELTKLSVELMYPADSGNVIVADGIVAVYDDIFSATVGDEDSYKFNNASDNLAINANGTFLCIEGRPSIKSGDSLSLKIAQLKQKNYYFEVVGTNFPDDIDVFVGDRFLQTETVLALSDTARFPFSISTDPASYALNRFTFIYKAKSVLAIRFLSTRAFSNDNKIAVQWNVAGDNGVTAYEITKSIDGQHFIKVGSVPATETTGIAAQYDWFDNEPTQGTNYYQVRAIIRSGNYSSSKIATCNWTTNTEHVAVYPNPVKQIIQLHLSDLKQGFYQVIIFNPGGQKVFSKQIHYNGGTQQFSLTIADKNLSAGIYQLQVTDNKTNYTTQVTVQ